MEDKKVVVLMSTYNGEKYIEEQLDSIISQTYNNIEILIRDDGSKDSTVEIVQKYINSNKNIVLIKGENIGFINSFFELIKKADNNADYFAYCDQDDIWMEDKIKRAVSFMENSDSNKPVLYFSNSDYYDSDMNFLKTAEKNKIYSFRNSLVECVTQGMTMVINKQTKELIAKDRPQNCLYHDWWTYMICSGFGEIIYDEKSLVKYRRHNKSVTVEGKSSLQLLIWRIKEFFIGKSLNKIKKQWIDYKTFYYEYLNEENKKLLNLFTIERYNFFVALKKVFYPKRFRRKLIDELSVRLLFLLGKL